MLVVEDEVVGFVICPFEPFGIVVPFAIAFPVTFSSFFSSSTLVEAAEDSIPVLS